MTQSFSTISALITRYVIGEATPEEKRQLYEWASLSAENRNLLELFSENEELQHQPDNCPTIDLDERRKTLWEKVAAPQKETKPQKAMNRLKLIKRCNITQFFR